MPGLSLTGRGLQPASAAGMQQRSWQPPPVGLHAAHQRRRQLTSSLQSRPARPPAPATPPSAPGVHQLPRYPSRARPPNQLLRPGCCLAIAGACRALCASVPRLIRQLPRRCHSPFPSPHSPLYDKGREGASCQAAAGWPRGRATLAGLRTVLPSMAAVPPPPAAARLALPRWRPSCTVSSSHFALAPPLAVAGQGKV